MTDFIKVQRQSNSQRPAWSSMSVLELRLRSAMWYRSLSGTVECCDWLFWAILSRAWTMAWRRQVIHCCLLKESLACRLYGWAFERPLLLTRKQFLTGREGGRQTGREDTVWFPFWTHGTEWCDCFSLWHGPYLVLYFNINSNIT